MDKLSLYLNAVDEIIKGKVNNTVNDNKGSKFVAPKVFSKTGRAALKEMLRN